MIPRLKPHITVLHIEDELEIAKSLKVAIEDKRIYSHHVDNLTDAKNILKKFDVSIVVVDGMFPFKKGGKPVKAFIPFMNWFDIQFKPKKQFKPIIIPWSNSTHVHEYCNAHKITSFSKIAITKERFTLKKRKFIPIQNRSGEQMAQYVTDTLFRNIDTLALQKQSYKQFYKEPATLFAIAMAIEARTKYFSTTVGKNYSGFFMEMKDTVFTTFASIQEDELIAKKIVSMILKESFFSQLKKKIVIKSSRLLHYMRNIDSKKLSQLSNVELSKMVCDAYEKIILMRVYTSIPTAMEHSSNKWTNILTKIVQKRVSNQEDQSKVFAILTTPEKISYIRQFEIACSKAACKGNKTSDIQNILSSYAWINYTFEGIPLTFNDIIQRNTEKTIEEHNLFIQDCERKQYSLTLDKKNLYEKYAFTAHEKVLFDIGADIVYIKFFRKGIFAETYFHLDRLFLEISKRLEMTLHEAVNIPPDELCAGLLCKNYSSQLVKNRIKDSLIYSTSQRTWIFPVEYMTRFQKRIIHDSSISLKGQSAYPGKVNGVVRIVNIASECNKVNFGDILVSRSTNPTLIGAMHKASGFITEIGGLTCHAAIIAREMKKPCIVGVTNATTKLHDGQKVTLDADKGIIL